MPKRSKHSKPDDSGRQRHFSNGPISSTLRVRHVDDQVGWELVHPRCALDRAEDLEEVQAMLDGGEPEIAIDELRWLLQECSDFIAAHRLLGELALSEDQDLELARGHFGYAYQLGLTALRRQDLPTPVAYQRPANQAFFEAGKGLAHCLAQLDKPAMAREVLETLLRCDPDDPLGLGCLLASLPAG